MNANIAKKFAVYALGAIVGGISGHFLGGLIVEKVREMEEQAERDRRVEEIISKIDPADVEQREVERNNGHKRTDYNKFSAQDKEDLNVLAAPYRSSIVSDPRPDPKPKDEPYVITFDQFEEECLHYEKVRINYYEADTTYSHVEPDEDIVDDAARRFGNAHLHFGEDSDDPDVVYVRFDREGVDYEITRLKGSYAEIVCGIIGENTEGGKPKIKKKKVVKNDKDRFREQQEDKDRDDEDYDQHR